MEESNLNQIKYVDMLKAIRNQLLDSTIICLVTKDKQSANSIFEILNGKGKQLDSIDLIKNTIFSKINKTSPRDNANEIWKKIKKELVSREKYIEFSTFYRHYWISKYKKVKDDQLYKEFTKTIKEENYTSFLKDLYSSSKQYVKIINPNYNDYNNRKEYKYIVEHLKYLNEYFNIKQIRVLLLALFQARFDKEILTNKKFKEILTYLHGFHFAYNALCTKRSNAFESKYSKFASRLNNAENKREANVIIDDLRCELDTLFPNYDEFEKAFIRLEFSKEKNKSNMISKYVLNNLEKNCSDSDIEPVNGSVEHILGESKDKNTLNIGNLILLEMNLNKKADDKKFLEKLPIYKESSYSYVKKFVDRYGNTENFDEKIINERAKDMAKLYYKSVLKREV